MDPVASTTKVEEDVDSRPPRGRYRWVRQRPPLRLKKTSMVGPLGHGDIAKEVIYCYKCSMLFILPRHWYLVETGIRI
jgi:hypothetical protein